MNNITTWIQDFFGVTPALQTRMAVTVIYLLGFWILYRFLMRVVAQRTTRLPLRYRWQKALSYLVFIFAAVIIGRIWFEGIDSLATYLGLLTAGLAIALQELIVSVAAWAFMLWRQPFQLGDRIQIGEYTGDVIDIGLFQFSLLEVGNWVDADQTTGRIIHIPNGQIFRDPQANYGQAFRYIWHEMPVMVTFESDWKKAKAILQEIVARHAEHLSATAERELLQASQKFMIPYPRLTSSVYTSVADSGVVLTMRYLCEPAERRDTSQAVWEDVLDAFALHADIDFAYPTQREIQSS